MSLKLAGQAALTVGASLFAFTSGFVLKDFMDGGTPDFNRLSSVFIPQASKKPPSEVFREHYATISARYYRKTEKDQLRYAAMQGMFSSLGDPHTNFLEPVTAEQFALENEGGFVGIGARLDDDPLGTKIVTVFEGSPAERAGVLAGDVVTEVDGESVAGLPSSSIVSRIRGEEGTVVKLTVMRKGDKTILSVRRGKVTIPTAEGRMVPDSNIGYISLTQFSETTPAQYREVMMKLMDQGAKGLVIDVRGNPGGVLESVSEIIGGFRAGTKVVTMKGRQGSEKTQSAPAVPEFGWNGPIAVLMNGESASAAEIMAGVLQELKGAILVGEHSYGKASVQNVFTLFDGASAKITTAKYFLPSGRDISRKVDQDGAYLSGGLKADIEVELKISEDTKIGEPGKDSQLDKAIAVVKEKMGQSAGG